MGKVIMSRMVPPLKAPSTGIAAGDLAVGSVVKLMEGGTAVEFLVVNQGKPSGSSLYDDSCDGTWLLRKDIHSNRRWHTSALNKYGSSAIHTWLNEDYFSSLGPTEQTVVKQVKIPFRESGASSTAQGGANGLLAKSFLLSIYEVGREDYTKAVDGAKLDYFEDGNETSARNKRIAYLDGSAGVWLLRSPYTSDDSNNINYVLCINSNGTTFGSNAANLNGIRPALILPKTALFNINTMLLKGAA